MKKIFTFLFLSTAWLISDDNPNSRGSVDDYTQLKYKVAMVTRTSVPPVIDGIIDDLSWDDAIIIDEFLQFEPYNLEVATVRTETRVLFDDKYLYIAFNNFDPNPESIMKRLARRDDWESGFASNSDWIGVGIDSRNDDKTGYWFAVNAAEVQVDVVIAGEGHHAFDGTWNVVWESKVSHNDKGWSAEIRIPFNVFQYSKDNIQEWGASFQRHYYGQQEEMQWPGRAKGVRGMVPHYGILKGLQDIPQPKNLELSPYLLQGQTETEDLEKSSNFGLDVRYNINSITNLNMTFNPDFGQVETDPSVLNLSAFETRLNERRPFFVEGANFYKSRLNLFNSRRIGQRPGFYSPESGSIVNRPEATTILGAAKIMGETASGMRFGIIEAITNQEYGTREFEMEGATKQEQFLLEPYTNYFIGRLEQPVINELSTIGFMTTDLRRQGETDAANVFSVDWRLKFMDNKWSFEGQAANSRIGDDPGYAGRFSLSYRDPIWWELSTWGHYSDENFNVNDLGYQQRNNNWYTGVRGRIRRDTPKGIFLERSLSLRTGLSGRGDGLITRKDIDLDQSNTFMNYWGMGWSVKLNPEVYEDDDLYRDSRAVIIKDEAWESYEFWFRTDRRKRFILRPKVDLSHGAIRGWGSETELELILRPTDYLNISVETTNENRPGSMQWVGIVEDSNNVNIIYANTKRQRTDTNVRINLALSPRMTFEAFYQPFKVDMDYVDYNRLVEEKSLNVEPYNYNKDKDFKMNNQVGTFVFRWEYLPGSLMYVVYNLHDNRYYSSADGKWYNTKANSLFFKLNYFFRT